MKATLAALLLTCLLVADVGAQLPSATVGDGLGVQTHWGNSPLWYMSAENQFNAIQASGVKFVRDDLLWQNVETTKGTYDFSYYDTFSNAMALCGIRILWTLDYGNPSLYGSNPNATWRQAFANYAAAAVTHFGGHNNIYELYNEPNSGFWPTGASNVNQYMALANQAIPAMRAADSNCTIIGPAVSNIDTTFQSNCFNYGNAHPGQKGLLDLVDAVSCHPYRSSAPETVAGDYATVRSLMQTYGGKTLPIVSSEWGYSCAAGAVNPPYAPVATAQLQGDYLARMMLVNLSQGIPLSVWYDWKNDDNVTHDPANYEENFGMTTGADVPKPAYNEMQLLTKSLNDETFYQQLSDGNSNDWLLVFKTPSGHQTLAAWTTGSADTATVSGWGTLQLSSTPFYVNPTLLPGDANLDGRVDVSDLAILAANYRKHVTGGWTQADFNHDGVVDVQDWLFWRPTTGKVTRRTSSRATMD